MANNDDFNLEDFLMADDPELPEDDGGFRAGGFRASLQDLFEFPDFPFVARQDAAAHPADRVEQHHVEQNPVQNPGQEPPQFEGLRYDEFNDFLRNHGIEQDDVPVTSRVNHNARVPSPPPRSPSPPLRAPSPEPMVQDEGLNVMQVAQNAVGQANDLQEYTHQEFIEKLLQERDVICNIMLGMLNRQTKPWKAYLASQVDQNEMQFLIELYTDVNSFLPRHCRTTCNLQTDALECCWQNKFGAAALEPNNAIRQNMVIQLFQVDATQVLTNMIERTNCRKTDNGLYPEHVHRIMEDWIMNRNADQNRLVPRGNGEPKNFYEEEALLALRTGLSINLIKRYKRIFRKKRYNFETKQIEDRLEPAVLNRRILAINHAGRREYNIIYACMQRHPGLAYKDIPKAEQEELCRQVGCSQTKMVDWYQRIRKKRMNP